MQAMATLRRNALSRRERSDDRRSATLPAGRTALNVATWNVHSCVGLDARFSPERTAAVLSGLGADIIGLQEVGWHHRGETGFDQFDYLASATGLRVLIAPTKDGPGGHFGNALLTRHPVREWTAFNLTLPGKEPRSGLDALLDVAGQELRVLVVHLGLVPWERARQMSELTARCDARPNTPTLLMGDFNEWAVSARRLTRLARRFPDCGCPPSFPAGLPTLRLDRFYVSAGLSLLSYEAVRKVPAFRASDHLPVVGRIALP
ncbi:endonuclease/exonuclease/phosphatase family protein [bacterium]|nr:endonuclease/exonuclease/phosphatase family protein [bacterium]